MPFYRLNKEYNQQGIYMTSTGPRSRGGARGKHSAESQMAQKKSETQTAKSYTLLEEGEQVGYSFLIQPVKTSFKKFSDEIKKIIGGGSTEATKPAAPVDESAKEAAEKAEKNRLENQVNDLGVKLDEFQAKLISAESIKTGAYICLPLPMQIPRDQLSVNYSVEDLGAAIAGYTLGSEAADRIANGGSLSGVAATGATYALRSVLQQILPKGVGTAFFGDIPNPFSANIFENVEPRSFTFTWMLQPKSQVESDKMREIINLLRYYALPQPRGLLLDLPHEFNIAFLGTEYLYAFSRCVISNIEVNHAPNGFNVFFQNGAPETVELSITFKEIFPLNKEVIMSFGKPSMTPTQIGLLESPQDASQSDAAAETPVAADNAATEAQINQQVADWKAKEIQRNKLIREREEAESYAPYKNRLPKINEQIAKLEVDMTAIKTEVDVLQAKINYKDRTGKTLKPLPPRP
jgi:hypothetical protein